MPSMSASSSESFQFPENPFLREIAQYAYAHANDLSGWANQQYQSGSDLTDNVVNNFLQASVTSRGLAQNEMDRYKNVFQPEEDQLVRDAKTYASAPRIAQEMGSAESGVAQAGEASRTNALQHLEDMGIDPSSGRYAALDRAERNKTAAAAAGAGQQARRATEQQGRAMRSEAIQVGERLPGNAINAINSSLNSLSGAENSKLALLNTGNQLMKTPNDYLGTAMKLGYPPTGNRSGSASSNSSGDSAGGGAGAGGAGRGGGGGAPGMSGGQVPMAYDADRVRSSSGMSGLGGLGDLPRYGGDQGNGGSDLSGDWTDIPWTDDPNADDSGQYGSGSDNSYGDYDNSYGDFGDYGDNSGGGDSYGDDSGQYNGGDGGGGQTDYDNSNGDFGDYAEGGEVDPALSPSRGQVTDDVQANVNDGGKANINVGEYIIPRDVAEWKGNEFFHNLVRKSREARVRHSSGAQHGVR